MHTLQSPLLWVQAAAAVGKFTWRSEPACSAGGSHIDELAKGCDAFAQAGVHSQLNCWEAIFWAGFRAVPTELRERLRQAVLNIHFTDFLYCPFVLHELLQFGERRPVATLNDLKPNKIVYFFGEAHVALSLGGGRVISLWYGPKGNKHLQLTSVGQLLRMIVANPQVSTDALIAACRDIEGADEELAALYDFKESGVITGAGLAEALGGDKKTVALFQKVGVATSDSLFEERNWKALGATADEYAAK